MHKSALQLTEEYVISILEKETPEQNSYHNLDHTKDVVNSVIEIAIAENLLPDDLELVQIAAWFHDIGYIRQSAGHEEISAMYASEFLTGIDFPNDRIDTIIGCILATKVPQKPKNLFEKILCDADLNHLGRVHFFERNNMFRYEFETMTNKKLSDREFLVKTIDFLTRHTFFTNYAIAHFSENKKNFLIQLQNQLDQILNS